MKATMIVAVSALAAASGVPLAPTTYADPSAVQQFQSPSGNIGCFIESDDGHGRARASCDIADRTWASPPRPPNCMGPYDRLNLREGTPARLGCHGDTALGTPMDPLPVLDYGETITAGPLTCESEPLGMTCTDSSTGHYFRLARDSYELH
jgi:hypothetical protein